MKTAKTGPKPETKQQLLEIAKRVYDEFGVEVINDKNFLQKVLSKTGAKLSRTSVWNWQEVIKGLIKKLDKENPRNNQLAIFNKLILDMEIAITNAKVSLSKLEVKQPETKYIEGKRWTGLLNYTADGKIIIQRAGTPFKHLIGCDLMDKKSIKHHFGDVKSLRVWLDKMLDEKRTSKLNSPDTETDIQTLKELKQFWFN